MSVASPDDGATPGARPRRDIYAYGLLFLTMFIWASAFPGLRYVLEEVSPMSLTVIRMTIASAALLVVGILLRVPFPRRADWRAITWAGLLGFTFYHIALNVGTNYITAGQASFIIATIPIWTSLLAARFLKERVTARNWLGMAIGVAGVGYMSLQASEASVSMGSVFVLLAAMFAAGNITVMKDLLGRYRAIDISVYAAVIGTAPLLLYAPWTAMELGEISPKTWLVLIYLATIPISLGYWLSSIALTILSASRTSQMLLLVPAMAALLAWFAIDEPPNERLFIGGPMIMVGVLLGNTRKRVKASKTAV